MDGWQLALEIPADRADTLTNLLEARGARVTVPAGGDPARLVATFEGTPDLTLLDALGAWLANLGDPETHLQTRRGDDGPWLEGWRAIFGASQLSERVWITPPWEPALADTSERVTVIVDPETAFGGGSHPTTAGVIDALDRCLAERPAGACVLDVGCGTGILAIAAARLGAEAVALDVNPAACRKTAENAAANGVAEAVTVVEGPVSEAPEGPYDVVVANVFRSVLVAVAPDVLRRVGGDLILSGFHPEDVDDIVAAYAGLELVARSDDRGWVALVLARAE